MSEGTVERGFTEQNLLRIVNERYGRGRMRLRPFDERLENADEIRGLAGKSGALRAAIFGINDGLVSNLSLIMGVAGAAVHHGVIVLAGIAGLLAGACSMGAGEYVSMRVQRELFERLIQLEAHELATMPDEEFDELSELYRRKGFPADLAHRVTSVVHADPALALDTHAREELGLDPDELGSPWKAAISSFVTFAVGATIPLLPFVFGSGGTAEVWAIGAGAVALFSVGSAMSIVTGRHPWLSGLRMLVVGAVAAGATFGIGHLFHVSAG